MASNLKIQICPSPDEAPNWRKTNAKALNLDTAIIVKNGTVEGNPTVDLVLTDPSGQIYVAMITGRLLKSVTQIIGGTNEGMN